MEIRRSRDEGGDLAALALERLEHAGKSAEAQALEEDANLDLLVYWGVAFARTREKTVCVARARVAKGQLDA